MSCVFFDIDGTLWDFRSVIPESTARAIRLLRENGHKALICTGRTRGYINNPALLNLGFDGIISGCGTRIETGDQVLMEHIIPKETAIRAVDTVRRHGFRVILEGPEYLYMEYDEFKDDPYGRKVMRDLGGNYRSITGHYGEWVISKFSCDMTGCEKGGCFLELSDEFYFIEHDEVIAEAVPKGFSKGTGIRTYCDLTGEDAGDTVAIGDGANDIDMFEAAGFSVAMGSGAPKALESADYVTSGLKEDGVYNALSHLGLI